MGGADPERATPRRPEGTTIDRVSKAIIEMLQVDGRRPFAEIATELQVSEESVRRRVTQLTETGVIQITAVSDPLQHGFARQAMIGITVKGAPEKAVAEALAEISEVVGVSDAHLLELVTSRIKPIPGVASIHTFLDLELQKQTYTWGVR